MTKINSFELSRLISGEILRHDERISATEDPGALVCAAIARVYAHACVLQGLGDSQVLHAVQHALDFAREDIEAVERFIQ